MDSNNLIETLINRITSIKNKESSNEKYYSIGFWIGYAKALENLKVIDSNEYNMIYKEAIKYV